MTTPASPTPLLTDGSTGIAGPRPASSRPWLLLAVAIAAVAVPMLVLAIPLLAHSGPYSNFGDVATMELAVQRATEIDQTVGPYSRYGWNHPGPLVFYLLAVPYRLLGGQGEALALGAIAINAAASVWLVALIGRRSGARAALAAAAVVGALQLVLSMPVLADAWTPFLITVPSALFLVLCADACTVGGRWSLAVAVAVGSFLVQTHVAMAAPVTVVLALTVAVWAWSHRRRSRRVRSGSFLMPLVLAVGTGLVLWSPPLWQELRARPGNLTALARFFLLGEGTTGDGHGAGEAAGALAAGVLGTRPHLRPDLGIDGGNVGLLLVVLGAIAAVSAVSWRRRRWFPAALSGFALVTAAVAYATLLRVEGLLHGYLVLWTAAIPVAGVLAAVVAAVPARPTPPATTPPTTSAGTPSAGGRRGPGWTGPAATAVLVVLTVSVGAVSTGAAISADPQHSDPRVVAANAAVSTLLGPGERDVLVCIIAHEPGPWGVAVGAVTDLRRRGVDARVQDHWLVSFGDQLAPDGGEQVLLELDTTLGPARAIPLPQVGTAVTTDDLRARLFTAPDGGPVDQSACPPPV